VVLRSQTDLVILAGLDLKAVALTGDRHVEIDPLDASFDEALHVGFEQGNGEQFLD